MKKPTRVLVLGGGYVAIHVCRALKRAIERGEVEVTVLSRENYHVWHGYVSEMITGRIGPGQILSPARRIFSPARIHVGEIESVDLVNKKVVTSRQLDGRQYELEYDQVVLALGTAENYDAYPGLAEHAFRLKAYDDCFRLKNHLLTMFEMADIESDPAERRRLLTFFVAGGGYAGTELAGELADYVRLLTSREYKNIRREECRVVLVHPGPHILPELLGSHPRLVEFATNHLRKLGVELMTSTRVTWATPNEVGLSNGERIPTRTIVSAIGTRPPRLLDSVAVPRDERGKVKADKFLRVEGMEGIWTGGDCAAVPYVNGGTCPPVALFAMEQGKYIGENILRTLAGQELKPFNWGGLGQGVSIGGRTAVGEFKGKEFTGLTSWLVWRALTFWYVPSMDRKLRILADWLIWPLVGRDIVEMSVADADDYEISHHVFQPGEVVQEEGQMGRYIYLITEGEAEAAQAGSDQVKALGPGAHFGQASKERKVAETVRAKTVVRAVSVRADQASRLQRVLKPLGDMTAAASENR